jgi:hypothetical protein
MRSYHRHGAKTREYVVCIPHESWHASQSPTSSTHLKLNYKEKRIDRTAITGNNTYALEEELEKIRRDLSKNYILGLDDSDILKRKIEETKEDDAQNTGHAKKPSPDSGEVNKSPMIQPNVYWTHRRGRGTSRSSKLV